MLKILVMVNTKKNSGVTAITKRDIGHPQGLSFGFPPPGCKLASLQAFEPTYAGLKPDRQGFKPQAIKFQFQDSVSRVQAYKLGVRGSGNEDK